MKIKLIILLLKTKLETKKINISKEEKITKLETIKVNKIKPKLKPKPIEKIETKSDMKIQNKIKPEIKKNEEKKTIDKPKPFKNHNQILILHLFLKILEMKKFQILLKMIIMKKK